MQSPADNNLQDMGIWKRVFYMLVYGVVAGIVRLFIWIVILMQLITVVFTGNVNQHLLLFSRSLAAYLFHILLFLTFNTDELAFPFAGWNLTKETTFPKPRA